MCGISGIVLEKKNIFSLKKDIKRMVHALKHRGPDKQKYWIDKKNNIALGHTRLSIQDLSTNGSQPMESSNKRYVIVFNGEIYNHLELRSNKFFFNKKWKSTSDTETLIELIQKFGIKKTLEEVSGMFAFGLFDKRKKKLYLVRDLYGEKPLYFGWQKEKFFFSSELSAIMSLENFRAALNHDSIIEFLKRSYIPSPLSIFKDIYKLKPGHYLELDLTKIFKIKSNTRNLKKKINSFQITNWKNNIKIHHKFKNPENEILNLLKNSVKEKLLSDAPIGCFLSGGIDSSLITCVASEFKKNIKTFSMNIGDKGYSEKKFSDIVAKKLKTNHHIININKKELLNIIKNISNFYSEPFADSSQIPSIILSKYTSKHVKVVLTGDGADEFFGGYNRYYRLENIWNLSIYFPRIFIKYIFKLLNNIPIRLIKKIEIFFSYLNINTNFTNQFTNKFQKICYSFSVSNNFSDFFNNATKENWINEDIFKEKKIKGIKVIKNTKNHKLKYFINLGKQIDLSDDMLCKIDRASMAFGLETRTPFLDKILTDYMDKLPKKYQNLVENKKILKQFLDKYIFKGFSNRPKMGFSIPIDNFLKNELKSFMLNILSKKNIEKFNLIHWNIINNKIDEHLKNKKNNGRFLWSLIVLFSWLQKNNKKIQF